MKNSSAKNSPKKSTKLKKPIRDNSPGKGVSNKTRRKEPKKEKDTNPPYALPSGSPDNSGTGKANGLGDALEKFQFETVIRITERQGSTAIEQSA